MDKNTWIGFLLIAAIIVGFNIINRPSEEEIAERKRIQDSIAVAQKMEAEAQAISQQIAQQVDTVAPEETIDELNQRIEAVYGPFALSAKGEQQNIILENNKIRLHLSTLGGYVQRAELKEYKAYGDSVNALNLFRGDESQLSFTLITNNNRVISTKNLYFEPIINNPQNVTLRLKTNIEDAWLDFVYTLHEDDYMVGFEIKPQNMQYVLAQNVNMLDLQWNQLIPQQERGRTFEERYSQLQYMLVGGEMEKLSEQKHDQVQESARIKWIGYKDQYFSTVLIANSEFQSSTLESTPKNAISKYIKEYKTTTSVAFDITCKQTTGFTYYFGPNHYNTLKSYDENLSSDDKLNLKELLPLG